MAAGKKGQSESRASSKQFKHSTDLSESSAAPRGVAGIKVKSHGAERLAGFPFVQ